MEQINNVSIIEKASWGLKKLYKFLAIFLFSITVPYTALGFIVEFLDPDEWLVPLLIYLAVCTIGLTVSYFITSKLELNVYPSGIDGKYYFGKKFMLEFGDVQTVQRHGINGIKIICRNGRVYKFVYIENRDDICTALKNCGVSINMNLTKDENSVITSELDIKKHILFKAISIISALLSMIFILISWIWVFSSTNYHYVTRTNYFYYGSYRIPYEDSYLVREYDIWELPTTLIAVAFFVFFIVFLVMYFVQSNNRVSISPTLFRGVHGFGKVQLIQIEQIEGTTTAIANSSISINCMGKTHRYYWIKNNNLLCQTINDIKSGKKDGAKFENQRNIVCNETLDCSDNTPTNNISKSVEEIKQLKALLDEGVISQEEFNIKKKQILDL